MNKTLTRKPCAKSSLQGCFKRFASSLSVYLIAVIGTALIGTSQSDAAIIMIDFSDSRYFSGNLGAVNAGVPYGSGNSSLFPYFEGGTGPLHGGISGGSLNVINDSSALGMYGTFGLSFASSSSFSFATPTKFTRGQAINSSSIFPQSNVPTYYSAFKKDSFLSPDFSSGSYMGFEAWGRYGWMEVTWTSATNQFRILSAAYESVGNVAIAAGDTGTAAVPEPGQVASSLILLALGAAGVAIQRQRAKRKQA
jgi:hypothetical protein